MRGAQAVNGRRRELKPAGHRPALVEQCRSLPVPCFEKPSLLSLCLFAGGSPGLAREFQLRIVAAGHRRWVDAFLQAFKRGSSSVLAVVSRTTSQARSYRSYCRRRDHRRAVAFWRSKIQVTRRPSCNFQESEGVS